MWIFSASLNVSVNKLLNHQSNCRWFETSLCSCDVTVMIRWRNAVHFLTQIILMKLLAHISCHLLYFKCSFLRSGRGWGLFLRWQPPICKGYLNNPLSRIWVVYRILSASLPFIFSLLNSSFCLAGGNDYQNTLSLSLDLFSKMLLSYDAFLIGKTVSNIMVLRYLISYWSTMLIWTVQFTYLA